MNDDTETNESYAARERQWDDQWPTSMQEDGVHGTNEPDVTNEVMPFPDVAGTMDPAEATRDAEPYMPPVDPPVLPGGRDGVTVATGFGISPEEEAQHDRRPLGDEDIRDQALLTLQQDSLSNQYNLDVRVNQGVVHLVGGLPSVDDADHITSVLGELPGVVDVIDDTTLDPTLT
ncbi:MAG: BON domain-containing protein [Chloroflexota bacterium]